MLKKTPKSVLAATSRPEFFRFHNGEKAPLPFSQKEYDRRLKGLRAIMSRMDIPAVVMTSMHNIAYYSGFLYCSFGRPYACVVTHDACITVSANIDAGQPWRRSHGDNITYTDWQRDNFWRAVKEACGKDCGRVGIEADHLTLAQRDKATAFLGCPDFVDIAKETMKQRMVKSPEEIKLITSGANVADIGGYAIRDAIHVGAREIDIAMAGRDAMELAIAERHPDSECATPGCGSSRASTLTAPTTRSPCASWKRATSSRSTPSR
jgi:creatinase